MTLGRPVLATYGLGRSTLCQPARWAMGVLLVIALAVVANLARLELGAWSSEAIQVDELFFAACAARGNATGELPVPGCHDNKAPIIFLVHQLVQLAAGAYELGAMKVVAYAVVAVVAVQLAILARHLGGWQAALAAPALMLLTLSNDANLFALKTETVGTAFILAAMTLWIVAKEQIGAGRWFAIGVCFGLATMTKQTYAVAGLAVIVHRMFVAVLMRDGRYGQVIRDVLACGVGMALPLLAFLAWFSIRGGWAEFLGNLVIYPSVYGTDSDAPTWQRLIWTVSAMMETFSRAPLVPALFASALVFHWWPRASGVDWRAFAQRPTTVLSLVIGVLLLVLAAAPAFFRFHLLPVWILASLLAGVLVAQVLTYGTRVDARCSAALCTALLAFAVLMAHSSVSTRGGRSQGFERHSDPARWTAKDREGTYAYVHGVWPYFYAHNKLVPASNVMFPWALPGVPAKYVYRTPPTGSWRARLLHWAQQQSAKQLQQDFKKTPPHSILVAHDIARAPGSLRISDVEVLDDYIKSNCEFSRMVIEKGLKTSVYHCRVPGK